MISLRIFLRNTLVMLFFVFISMCLFELYAACYVFRGLLVSNFVCREDDGFFVDSGIMNLCRGD